MSTIFGFGSKKKSGGSGGSGGKKPFVPYSKAGRGKKQWKKQWN